MKVKYQGMFAEVEVPALANAEHPGGLIVKQGETITVEDDEIGHSLLDQVDNWKAVGTVPADPRQLEEPGEPPPDISTPEPNDKEA